MYKQTEKINLKPSAILLNYTNDKILPNIAKDIFNNSKTLIS